MPSFKERLDDYTCSILSKLTEKEQQHIRIELARRNANRSFSIHAY